MAATPSDGAKNDRLLRMALLLYLGADARVAAKAANEEEVNRPMFLITSCGMIMR